jgi:hypothetical protein
MSHDRMSGFQAPITGAVRAALTRGGGSAAARA